MNNQHGWIAWFTYNPVAANLLMVAILLVGLTTALNIRTEGFPAPAPRNVTVSVALDGASPRDVEEGAAVKVEQALNGVAGIQKVTSTVTANEATITVQSVDGYSLSTLKENIQSRVDAISNFPTQVSKTTVSAEQEDRHVIYVQVSGATDLHTLKEAARRVRQELLMLPAISKVTTEGSRKSEISIEISENRLRAFDLTPAEVATAVQGESVNLSAGTLQTDSGIVTLQSRNQSYFGAELEQVIIRSSPEGGVVRLGDIAQVVDGFAEAHSISLYNGKPSIRLDVQLTGKDSITAASNTVAELIADQTKIGFLPKNITVSTWSDEAEYIRSRLSLMSENALLGIGLVFIMLSLFLNIRVALWVALGIPISFAGTLYVIGPVGFDYSLNELTTFAFIIVLGVVVDDAIVIGESIFSHKERDGGGAETAVRGALEVAKPATFGVLTTVAAFLPLTMISSDFGGPFRVIAVVVIICLFFSLVESKLILPAHLAHLQIRQPTSKVARFWKSIQQTLDWALSSFIRNAYSPILRLAINNLLISLVLCIAILIAAVGLITRGLVQSEFFPEGESTIVYADITLESGAPAEQNQVLAKWFDDSLVETGTLYQERFGLLEPPIHNRYVSSSSTEKLLVSVELAGGADRSFSAAEFASDWREIAGPHPLIRQVDFYTGFADIQDLEIELSDPDAERTEEAISYLASALSQVGDLNDIKTNLDDPIAELTFNVLPLGERLGITNLSLITQLRNSIYGFEAQKILRREEEIGVRIRSSREARNSVSDLNRTLIATPDGSKVPLTEIAQVTRHETPQKFDRSNGQRVLTLTAKVNRTITSPQVVLGFMQSEVFPDMQARFPTLSISIAGEAEQEGKATTQLATGFVLALLAIYALLAIPLKSYLQPLVIMCAIPFGIVGAILGHLIISIPISLLSFLGILALSGVVVNDALVLVSLYSRLREDGMNYSHAIQQAGPARFRAIFLTSITTFVGLAPLVWETSEQAQILIPMAVSLAFGLLFATTVTLLIVPILLGISENIRKFFFRQLEVVP